MSGAADESISGKGIGMLMAIHGAVRRDLARLAVGAKGLAAYWACLAQQLHHHHNIEDAEVFPYVRTALGDRAAVVMDKMGTEHDAIDEAQAGVEVAVATLTAEPTTAQATRLAERLLTFQQVVLAHLGHEEAEAIPLIVEGFDEGYWQAFGRRQQDPGGDTFLPWVLDGAPAPAVAEVTGALPPTVQELLVKQWQPAHAVRLDALPTAR